MLKLSCWVVWVKGEKKGMGMSRGSQGTRVNGEGGTGEWEIGSGLRGNGLDQILPSPF